MIRFLSDCSEIDPTAGMLLMMMIMMMMMMVMMMMMIIYTLLIANKIYNVTIDMIQMMGMMI
jgi:hypothetical protein